MGKTSFKTAGFYSNRAKKLNGPPNGEPWIWLPLSLVESEAFRSLSVHATRALFRILAEHAHQGGRENGRLRVTKRDFYEFGVNWREITGAVQELEQAGLVKVTYQGRKVCGTDKGAPRQFALTWLPIIEPDNLIPPSNEWRNAKSKPAATFRRASRWKAARMRSALNGPVDTVDIEGGVHAGPRGLSSTPGCNAGPRP
jgi:hypothetical protein